MLRPRGWGIRHFGTFVNYLCAPQIKFKGIFIIDVHSATMANTDNNVTIGRWTVGHRTISRTRRYTQAGQMTTSYFLVFRNPKDKSHKIYWKTTAIKDYKLLDDYFRYEHPKGKWVVIGGGKMSMDIKTKSIVFFGSSPMYGGFPNELLISLANQQFAGWSVKANTWESKLDKAIQGWTKCQFKWELYQGYHSKAAYSLRLKDGTIVDGTYPTVGQFMNLANGTLIPVENVMEIKRISHKRPTKN